MIDRQDQDRSRLEDEWIVIRCQLGERPAFDELIRRWHEPIWKYIRRQAGNDDAADEIAQEAWIRVLRSIGRLREPSRLRAWLFGIARCTWLDRLRQQYASAPRSDIDLEQVADVVPPDDIERDLVAMEGALDRLPLLERDVLMLFYLRELSLEQVADVLEVPIGTVKSRLFRARNLLRSELNKMEPENVCRK